MNRKKIAFLATASLVLGLMAVGCAAKPSGGEGGGGGGSSKDADLTYWCPSVDNTVMETLVTNFKASNADYADLKIERAANWGEGETSAQLIKDIDSAADVMLMADDNIRACVASEALAPLTEADVTKYTTEAGAGAVEALSIDDELYGIPYRADNSPMPFYDKTLFSGDNASKLNSLEGMLEVAKANNKKVYLDMGNGWYNPFMFWSAGGDFGIHKESNGTLTIATNFGNQNDQTKARRAEIAKVLEATKALYNKYQDEWVISSEDSLIEAGFKDNEIAVAFLWNDIAALQKANANVSVTKWPTLTVGDKALPLHCFQSYKAIVCKNGADEERVDLALEFGRFLASPEAQRLRATSLSYGPANLSVAAEFDAETLPFSTAITQMANAGLTHSQAIRTTSDFWTPIGNLGGLVTDKTATWGTYGTADRAIQNMLSSAGWNLTAIYD